MNNLTIRHETSAYFASHGREPRGFGCWAFEVGALNSEGTFFTGAACSYTEAKARLRIELEGLGYTGYVRVQAAA